MHANIIIVKYFVVKKNDGFVGSWQTGQDLCVSKGGVLATIPDKKHFYEAQKVCKSEIIGDFSNLFLSPHGCWIGIKKKESTNNPYAAYFGDYGFGGSESSVKKVYSKPPWYSNDDSKKWYFLDYGRHLYYGTNKENNDNYWKLFALCEPGKVNMALSRKRSWKSANFHIHTCIYVESKYVKISKYVKKYVKNQRILNSGFWRLEIGFGKVPYINKKKI